MKPSYGVMAVRCQVNDLHDGHLELFRQVKARHDGVIIFVGVSPGGLSQNNPLDFVTIKRMIEAKFVEFTVLPLEDKRTDEEWSRELDNAIALHIGPGTATLYGGRDSFVPRYKGRFIPIELTLPLETMKVSGTDIRNAFSNKVIESPEFRAAMIYASCHRWPEVFPCVDIAIFNSDETELLLGQKIGEAEWRFIGGHFEAKKHSSYEMAARLEVMEETELLVTSLDYVGSAVIDDWRYASPEQGVSTAFFKGKVMSTGAKARDDIHAVRWFQFNKLTEFDLVPEHRVLFQMLKQKHNQVLTKAG